MSLPNKYEMGVDALYIPREFKILTYHADIFKILILMCSKKIHKLLYNNVIFNSSLNMKERRTLTDKMINCYECCFWTEMECGGTVVIHWVLLTTNKKTRMHSSRMRTSAAVAVWWSGVSGRVSARYPPSVNRLTDACENITLPQLRCRR